MDYISSPGRILGIIFLIATAILFIMQERKKGKERKERREARLAAEALESKSSKESQMSLFPEDKKEDK